MRSTILSKKAPKKSVAKNNPNEMKLRKLLLGTFIKNLRIKMLPNNLLSNSDAKNNRTNMLSRKLSLATFVKKVPRKMVIKKTTVRNGCLNHYRLKRLSKNV